MAGSILFPKVLDILKEYLVEKQEVQIEIQEDMHIFTPFCGSLCYWQEDKNGAFREHPDSLWVSEEEMLDIIRKRLEEHRSLQTLYERRKRNVPGFHLESVLLPKVLSFLFEECCLGEGEITVSYAYTPGDSPSLEDLDENATWVTISLRGTKKVVCRWYEEFDGGEIRFSDEDELEPWESCEDAIKALKKSIKKSSVLFWPTLQKLRNSQKEIEELKEMVEYLRQKKREIKYAPGNVGANNAREHFEAFAKSPKEQTF